MSKRKKIIAVATRLFAERGFRETSMARLSRETGAAEGTIFHHFKNKEALFIAILKDIREGIIREFEGFVAGGRFGGGTAMLEGIVSFYLFLAVRRSDWFLLLHRHYPYGLAEVNPECRRLLSDIYNGITDHFEEAIVRGGSAPAERPRKTALVIFSMVNGLVWFRLNGLVDDWQLHGELVTACRRIVAEH